MNPMIENEANQLLRRSGVENIYPVPLIPIAESLGYKIKEFEPDTPEKQKISGLVHYSQANILINAQEPAVRKRFTIAHEFGHIILHGNENYIDYRSSVLNDTDACNPSKESEANAFAAALLMPAEAFRRILKQYEYRLLEVAAYFDVSTASIPYRMKNLGCIPK